MTDETLYRRVVSEGGRVTYEPAARRWDRDVWPLGWHVVGVLPGERTTCYSIEPDRARVLAALREARPVLRDAVARALAGRPTVDDETHRQAFEAYREAGGMPGWTWLQASAEDVLRALEEGIDAG